MRYEQTEQTTAQANDLEIRSQVVKQQLWRVRLSLFWKNLRSSWVIFSENPVGLIGLIIIAIFGLMALSHPILMSTVWDPIIYDPITGHDFAITSHPTSPSASHLLGTDPLGRDVLSQILYSTSSEFALGMVAAIITVSIGTTVGAVAAYYGGLIDELLMRLADLIIMLPSLPLLIVIGAFFNLNLLLLALVLGILSGFGGVTVIIKSQALTIKVKPYIEAARVAGGSDSHIIFTHIVPNLMPLAFLYMMFTVTNAIFSEAVLSYFGLMNVRMSWGIMINLAQSEGYLLTFDYWWLLFPASVAITLLCAAFYLVGRALDEVINPRLRRR